MPLTLTSSAFEKGGTIPQAYTCEGRNVSPPFAWGEVPDEAKSLLLTCDDPDAPRGTFSHWTLYNIPPDWTELPEDIAAKASASGLCQATNDFGRPDYGGPCPPRGDAPHGYRFRLCALRDTLRLTGPRATCVEVARLAAPMEIAAAELIGFFGRE